MPACRASVPARGRARARRARVSGIRIATLSRSPCLLRRGGVLKWTWRRPSPPSNAVARIEMSQIAEPPVATPPADGRTASADDAHELIELDVTGMSCGSCAARVQAALGSAPGVAHAVGQLRDGARERRGRRGRRGPAAAGRGGRAHRLRRVARSARARARRRRRWPSWRPARSEERADWLRRMLVAGAAGGRGRGAHLLRAARRHRTLDRRGADRADPVLVRAAVPARRLGHGRGRARPTWTR